MRGWGSMDNREMPRIRGKVIVMVWWQEADGYFRHTLPAFSPLHLANRLEFQGIRSDYPSGLPIGH